MYTVSKSVSTPPQEFDKRKHGGARNLTDREAAYHCSLELSKYRNTYKTPLDNDDSKPICTQYPAEMLCTLR